MKYKTLLMALLIICNTNQLHASQLQTSVSIKKAITHYVASNLPLGTEYNLTLGQMDSRLKLPLCKEPLEIFTHSSILKPGRNSIGVRCHIKRKWTIYTSAILNIYKNVIMLSQPIRRGKIFSKNILQVEKRNVSTLRSGFITDPLTIINKEATRNLNVGSILNKSNYTDPKLIKRGDNVTIKVNTRNLTISMAGIAVMDGIKGQRIKVKNIKSKQIIQATVEKQGQVVVTF